jgi:hypothetical protein
MLAEMIERTAAAIAAIERRLALFRDIFEKLNKYATDCTMQGNEGERSGVAERCFTVCR